MISSWIKAQFLLHDIAGSDLGNCEDGGRRYSTQNHVCMTSARRSLQVSALPEEVHIRSVLPVESSGQDA
jgi:hypothetical protein